MKNITHLFIAVLGMFVTAAHAHPGHDHDHWLSNSIHVIFYLALAGVAAVLATLAVKYVKNKKQEK